MKNENAISRHVFKAVFDAADYLISRDKILPTSDEVLKAMNFILENDKIRE
jgi:hypothetical protein